MNPTRPLILLRCEGAAVFAGALTLYVDQGYGWLLFVLMVMLPDLAMLGYLAGPRVGATTYNLAHTLVWPVGLAAAGVVGETDGLVAGALVWLVHIGFDRMLGYGLKEPTGFGETHLGRVGGRGARA